jgi:hypothetical protein
MTIDVGAEAVRLDLTIEQGTRFNVELQWLEDDEITPIDITGFGARMDIRPEQDSPDADIILTLNTTNGLLTVDGPNGIIVMDVPASTTEALDFDCAVYDLELVRLLDADDVERLVFGDVTLSTETTRTTPPV